MPNNLKTYKISDFIDINPLVKLKANESYSFVEMKDLDSNNRTVLPSNFKTLNGGARFQNDDTLFARITPCLQNGKICQVKGLTKNVGFGSTEFLVFRGKKGISDTNFVYYLSREPFFRQFAENNMIGTSGRQRVAKQAFQNLELELPPLDEQQAIASILSAIDDKIENNLAINKTLEEMAMALYKNWFIDFGSFQDGGFVESELGMIPKGWEVKTFDSIGDFKNGKGITSKLRVDDGKYIILGSNGIIGKTNEILFSDPVIAIGRVGANYGEVHYSLEPCWISDNAITVKPKNKNNFWFLYQIVRKVDYSNFAIGSAQPLITQSSVKALTFICPDNDSLCTYSKKIDTLYKKLNYNLIENQYLTQLRDTLLPKLISGEIRLKEFKKEVLTIL